jgi:Mn-dependent DtxR family transcriptional regulator
MGKVPELSLAVRGQIVGMRNANLTLQQIATALKISKSTASRTLQRVQETGCYESRKRSGQPKKLDDRMLHKIRRLATINPFISSAEIVSDLRTSGLRTPCARRIRQVLHTTLKLPSRRPAKKPLLTPGQKQKRLEFCRQYEHWTVEEWSKVLWSDESTFEQFGVRKRHVRRPVGKRFDPRYTIKTMKHPASVMVWGCFAASGRGTLFFLPKNQTMNQFTYLSMLQEKLKLGMEMHECTIFQQDGARCHTAKSVMKWLGNNGITTFQWPGNSADLNPIENLWDIMKDKVAEKKLANMKELIEAIKLCWCREVSLAVCANLVASMPQRIRYVLDHNGESCPY